MTDLRPGVYVAGKTHDFERVRVIQHLFESFGWRITYDWTRTVETVNPNTPLEQLDAELVKNAARRDLQGVLDARLIVALGNPRICGTTFELGLATSWGKPCWLVDWEAAPASVFWTLPNMRHMFFSDLPEAISSVTTVRQGVPPVVTLPVAIPPTETTP